MNTCYDCGKVGALYRVLRSRTVSGTRYAAPIYCCQHCGKHEIVDADGLKRMVTNCIWKGPKTFG